jgi:sugar phosphate isomerase/epimerase
MMKTSFSTLACPEWGLPEVLKAAVSFGFDGVELRVISRELDLWNLPDFRISSLASTRRLIEDRGVRVVSMGSSACFHSPDAQERQCNFDAALRMAEVAEGLGAPSIRVFGDRIQAGCEREQTVEWIADSLTRLAERLTPSGVEVWLETHGDFATADTVGAILARLNSAQIGIIWDPANAFADDGEQPVLSRELSSRLRHVHVKDLRRDASGSAQYVLTGDGEFPFDTMFASLEEAGFDAFVSFEWEKLWHPELADAEIALPHFMEWWKSRGAR